MDDKPLSELKAEADSSIALEDDQGLKDFVSDLFFHSDYQFASFSFSSETIDPLAYLEMYWKENEFQYYWEKPSEAFAIAAGGEIDMLTASGEDRFKEINKQFNNIRSSTAEYSEISHPYSGFFLLGGFSFFDHFTEDRWNSFAPALFTLPEWTIIKDGKFSLVTFNVNLDQFSSAKDLYQFLIRQRTNVEENIDHKLTDRNIKEAKIKANASLPVSKFNHQRWVQSVAKAKQLITENKFDKIVLARSVSIPRSNDVTATQLVNKLRKQYSNCYNFLLHAPSGDTFLGSTPERLISARNRLLLTEALAGSIGRGDTATEDTILEKQLSGNTKDRDEHNFVIKDIEERLQPFVQNLKRQENPEVKKLSNVQHLYTPIRAHLHPNSNIFEVVKQLHPTPAVGGYPWSNAAPYINKLENFERGMYAGPIGWINGKGNLEFAVAIRSALFTQNYAHLFAGCGIVEDSDPQTEWEETNLKLRPLLSALQYD